MIQLAEKKKSVSNIVTSNIGLDAVKRENTKGSNCSVLSISYYSSLAHKVCRVYNSYKNKAL